MAKRKKTNNDRQNITQKTNNRATQSPLKTEGEICCSMCVTLVTNPVISDK